MSPIALVPRRPWPPLSRIARARSRHRSHSVRQETIGRWRANEARLPQTPTASAQRQGSMQVLVRRSEATSCDNSCPHLLRTLRMLALPSEALRHSPPAREREHKGVRQVRHLDAFDARLGKLTWPRPPGGAEHHVVEREPHREVLVAVLWLDRMMDAVILRARQQPPKPAEPDLNIGVDDVGPNSGRDRDPINGAVRQLEQQ